MGSVGSVMAPCYRAVAVPTAYWCDHRCERQEMPMTRDAERLERAQEEPIVGSLPDAPGILTADPADARTSASTCEASPTSCSSTTSRVPPSAAPSARCSRPPCRRPTTASSAWTRTPRTRTRCSSGRARRSSRHSSTRSRSDRRRDSTRRCARCSASRGPSGVRRSTSPPTTWRSRRRAGASDADVQLAVPHRRRVLDVQPHRRRLPRPDRAGHRRLPGARRSDRGARLHPAGHSVAR